MTTDIKIILIQVIFYFAFFSCNQAKKANQNLLIERYSNGNIKWEASYIGDTLLNGESKEYYETGELKSVGNYKNNKKEGIETEYWETGVIKTKSFYKNNLLIDIQTLYYPVGNILAKYHWNDGNKVGSSSTFYANGDVREYSYYSLNGKLIYRIKYDLFRKIESEEGDLTPVINFNNDQFNINDTFKSEIYLITPPNFQFELYTGYLGSSHEFINEEKLEIIDGKSSFQKILYNKKDYHWVLLYEVKSPDGSLRRYSNNLNIIVK